MVVVAMMITSTSNKININYNYSKVNMAIDLKSKKIIMIVLLIMIISVSLFGILMMYYLYQHPRFILLPYNKFISWYIGKEQNNKIFYTNDEKQQLFPISTLLELNYPFIKQELNLFIKENNIFNKEFNSNSNNLFSNFEKTLDYNNWNTIPVFLNGNELKYSRKYFPTIMKCIDESKGQLFTAIFSILEPGKQIEPHYGPFKGILRYHLGIDIPDGDCFINVNNEKYKWKNGEGILFDETHLHYAQNNTNEKRVILFIDVIRPLNTNTTNSKYIFNINRFICNLIKIAPHTISCLNEYNAKFNCQ